MTAKSLSAINGGMLNMVCPINWLSSLNRGLVSHWLAVPGLMGSIRFTDLCNRNHGTLTNGPTWQGPLGRPAGYGCLECDGTDDVAYNAELTPSINGQTAVTISCWANQRTAGVDCPYYIPNQINTQCAGFVFLSATTVRFDATTPGGTVTVANHIGLWNHMALTYDGATKKGFWNGVEVYSAAQTGALASATNEANIGRFSSQPLNPFDGWVDDCRLHYTCLSPAAIAALYQASRQGYPNELNWIRRPVGVAQVATATAFARRNWLGNRKGMHHGIWKADVSA